MTAQDGASLLSFIDTPVLVGDPDGCAVYANPAFESRFDVRGPALRGQQLASLFSGGARERVLQAVASVCNRGTAMRFRLREGGEGFWALVSPIQQAGEGLGVILLLTEESPCDQLSLQQPPAPRPEGQGSLREDAPARDPASAPVSGTLDPVRVVRAAARCARADLSRSGARVEVLAPARLPGVAGEAAALTSALSDLLRTRLRAARSGDTLILSTRGLCEAPEKGVLIALVEPPRSDVDEGGARLDAAPLERIAQGMGGRIHTAVERGVGTVTAMILPARARGAC